MSKNTDSCKNFLSDTNNVACLCQNIDFDFVSYNKIINRFSDDLFEAEAETTKKNDEKQGQENQNDLEFILTNINNAINELKVIRSNHFSDIKRMIDIRRESLLNIVNKISNEMIERVELSEKNWEKELVENQLDNFICTIKNENELKSKLRNLEYYKMNLAFCAFKNDFNFEKDSFGSLELYETFQNLLICYHEKNFINIFDLKTHSVVKRLNLLEEIFCVCICNNSKIITSHKDKEIKIWDLKSGDLLKSLVGHTEHVRCLKMLRNGLLLSGSADNTIKVWDISKYTCIKTLIGHRSWVECLEELPNEGLASGSTELFVKIWNLNDDSCINTLKSYSGAVNCLKSLPNHRIAVGSWKLIKIWNYINGNCIRLLTGHSDSIYGLELSIIGQLISCSDDKTIKIWDIDDGNCVRTINGHNETIRCIKLNNDGKLLCGSLDKNLMVLNIHSGECESKIHVDYGIIDMKFCTTF